MILLLLAVALIPSCAGEPQPPREYVLAIHGAVQKGDLAAIKAMVNGNPQILNARDPLYGDTPLHRAAYLGQSDLVRLLLTSGAGLNARNDIGYTALHWAAIEDNGEIVEILIAAGADINAEGNYGHTPLKAAEEYGSKTAISILRKQVKSSPAAKPGK